MPVYEWPERTARTAAAIVAYAENHRARAAHKSMPEPPLPGAREQATSILARARTQSRTLLLESEVKALVAAYGARIPRETLCTSPTEALAAGQALGKPCVLKIVSPDISHKSDIGGVRVGVLPAEVGIAFEEMVAEGRTKQPMARILGVSIQELVYGHEIIIGGLRDKEFGPMLMFGLGGIFVEILHDTSYRLVPATTDELLAMIREVKGYPLLAGTRGTAAVDIDALSHTLQAVAWLLTDFPDIVEVDLNPVFAGPNGATVADGRAALAES